MQTNVADNHPFSHTNAETSVGHGLKNDGDIPHDERVTLPKRSDHGATKGCAGTETV